ncbi:MAG: carboxylesterase family protein, partial [Hyphomonadaceae bacterium]|nr:carboxylesterase family protein [Hyphomonadaceae bacterium]
MNPTPEMRQLMRYPNLEMDATLAELVAQTPHFHLPVIGGADLRDQPQTLMAQSRIPIVPSIFGFTSFDGGGTLAGAGYTPQTFMARFADPAAIRAQYATDFAVSELQGAERVFGDRRYGLSARAAARAITANGGSAWLFYVTGPTNGDAGVRHGAYYRQLFSEHATRPLPLGQYLLNFARTGQINVAGLPNWPMHDARTDQSMVFDPVPQSSTGGAKRP